MTLLLNQQVKKTEPIHAFSDRITLNDGAGTMLHVVRYRRSAINIRLKVFPKPTVLPRWCNKQNISEALTGGFYLIKHNRMLGETWVKGSQINTVACTAPWNRQRACLNIEPRGNYSIASRHALPNQPQGDLLQAGPLLVRDGLSVIVEGQDSEGFSAASGQFDSDICEGRYPRTALGYDDTYIWSVVCDGRSDNDAGLSMGELAETLAVLGAEHAINLDGGASSVQISKGQVRNNPRGVAVNLPNGRPIYSALIFEPI